MSVHERHTPQHHVDPSEPPFSVIDPGLDEPIGTIGRSSTSSALAALEGACRAAEQWRATAARQRSAVLHSAAALLRDEREAFARTIVAESGKTLADAHAEVGYAADFLDWYGSEALRIDGEFRSGADGTYDIVVTHEPVGVALLITPWNFPLAMAARKIGPALAAGCTVILKPAEETPFSGLRLGDLLGRAGLPDGVLHVITPNPPNASVAALLRDPRVRALSFTGSTVVGRHLLTLAADKVTNCSMELGGAAPFIVLPDAPIDHAVAELLVAKFRNGGAACTAANGVFVHEAIARPFVERLSAKVASLRAGHGLDPMADVGAMITRRERDRVVGLIETEIERGARVAAGGGGPDAPGWFIQPTVLTEVDLGSPILVEEIFGPVAPVATFRAVDDVLAAVQQSALGLTAYVFSGDRGRAIDIARELEVGMVGINRGMVSDVTAPFGGAKASGIGREGGHHGIFEYLEPKYLAVAR